MKNSPSSQIQKDLLLGLILPSYDILGYRLLKILMSNPLRPLQLPANPFQMENIMRPHSLHARTLGNFGL